MANTEDVFIMPKSEEIKVFDYDSVFVSPEAMEEIKNWGDYPISDRALKAITDYFANRPLTYTEPLCINGYKKWLDADSVENITREQRDFIAGFCNCKCHIPVNWKQIWEQFGKKDVLPDNFISQSSPGGSG